MRRFKTAGVSRPWASGSMKPSSLYGIRLGHRGRTAEWGPIVVHSVRGGTVTFRGLGGIYRTTRSILWEAAWA